MLKVLKSTLAATFSLSMLGAQTCLTLASDARSTNQDKYVLAVGINDYNDPDIHDLNGCESDVEDFLSLLQEEFFAFPNNNAHMLSLKTRDATKSAIISNFRKHLVENAKENAQRQGKSRDKKGSYIFYFSGHGTQVPDMKSLDEGDRKDEAIVPVDATKDPASLIIDDEIGDLAKELTTYADDVTFIFDCCCSGTNTRNSDSIPSNVKVRFVDWSEFVKANDTDSSDVFDDDQLVQANSSFVVLSGCRSHERSNETEFGDSTTKLRWNGALTKKMIEILRANEGRTTYRDLSNALSSAVSNLFHYQHPQIEGDIDRRVFSSSKERATPYYQVTEVSSEDRTVTIKVGEISGLKEGGVVAFYAKDEFELKGNKGLVARGKVTATAPFSSQVEIMDKLNDLLGLQDSKVVIVTPDTGISRLKVALQQNAPKTQENSHNSVVKKLETDLVEEKLVKELVIKDNPLEISPKQWDTVVLLDTYKKFVGDGPRTKKAVTQGGKDLVMTDQVYYLATIDGAPLYDTCIPATDDDAAERLKELVRIRAHARQVESLENGTSKGDMRLEYQVIRKGMSSGSDKSADENLSPQTNGSARVEWAKKPILTGDTLALTVKNASDEDFYLGVLCVGTSGAVKLIYPVEGKTELVKAGAELPVVDCTVSGPSGVNTFKFIVSTEPVDLTPMQQDGIRDSEAGVGVALDDMILRSAGAISRTLTAEAPLPVEGWDVLTLNVRQIER
ncbi:MAG: caspase family protein [Cyanobacteria bacterium]|nr:caspase family protein [Cyanobacteriota bacterium]